MKHVRAILALTFVCLLFSQNVVFATPNSIDCGTEPVVITTDHSAQDYTDIVNLVGRIQSKGAVVAVHILQESNLYIDQYWPELMTRCPALADPSQLLGTKINALSVVVIVSQRKATIRYGGAWDSYLKGFDDQIQQRWMFPLFKQGKYIEGTKEGLKAILARLNNANPNPPVPPISVPVQVQAPNPAPTEPVDLSGLVNVLLVGFILVIVGILIYKANKLIFGYLAKRRSRKDFQQQAINLRNDVLSKLAKLNTESTKLDYSISGLSSSVSTRDLQPLIADQKSFSDMLSQAVENYQQAAGDPVVNSLSQAEYSILLDAYREANNAAEKAEEFLTKAKQTLQGLNDAIKNSEQAIQDLRNKITSFETEIKDSVTAQLKFSDSTKLINQAQAYLEQATQFRINKQYSQSLNAIRLSQDALQKGIQAKKDLIAAKGQVESAISTIPGRLNTAKAQIINAAKVFQSLVTTFSADSFESVLGNGTESEKRVNLISDTLAQLKSLASTNKWLEAAKSVNNVENWFKQIESFTRSIIELESSLQAAKKSSRGEYESAVASIASVERYLRQNDDDIPGDAPARLNSAKSTLATAEKELGKDKPNYLFVRQLINTALLYSNQELEKAESEVENAKRWRQQRESSKDLALAAVKKLANYIEDHSQVRNYTFTHKLAEIRVQISVADRESDDQNAARLYKDADDEATSILKKARREVVEDEESSYSHTGSWGSSSSSYPGSYSSSSSHSSHSSSYTPTSIGGSTNNWSSGGGGGSIGGTTNGW